jgi:hypothetical protein
MPDLNVHDNLSYAHAVFSDLRRIVIHTEYCEVQPIEYTDVVFSGVVAHHFECSLAGNILNGIAETELESLVDDYEGLFRRLKNYGWPILTDYETLASLCRQLRAVGVRAYQVDSSLGLTGFVLRSSVEYVKRDARAYPCMGDEAGGI